MDLIYLLDISQITKCKKEQINGPTNLFELLELLSEQYGPEFSDRVFNKSKNDLNAEIDILVNGINVAPADGIDTILKSEDSIAIIPEIMGG